MKFTSIPKKLVLTGMSAAMVVAFAPAVAQAAVTNDAQTATPGSTQVAGDVVATMSYVKGGTTYSQDFKSTQAYTNDDALQAALSAATLVSDDEGVSNATVKVQKDVTVTNPSGTDDAANQSYYYYNDAAASLVVGGKVTIDLNGKTVSNSADATYAGADAKQTPALSHETIFVLQPQTQLKRRAKKDAEGNAVKTTTKVYHKTGTGVNLDANGNPVSIDTKTAGNTFVADNTDTVKYDFQNGKLVQKDNGQYVAYLYTAADQGDSSQKTPAKNDVTIKGGTVSSVNAYPAVASTQGTGSTLTIDGATVTSNGAGEAVDATGNDVVLKGGANVSASLDNAAQTRANQAATDVAAVKAANVTVSKATKAADPYDGSATVTATLANGAKDKKAYGIQATGTYAANATVDVTATAGAGTSGTNGESTNAGGTSKGGIIDPTPTAPNTGVSSIAVQTGKGIFHYGNYTADTAVKATNGQIDYGTYNGWLNSDPTDSNIAVNGGKFKYDPSKNYDKRGVATTDSSTADFLQTKENVTYKVAQNSADSLYYVYRLGTTDVSYQNDEANGTDSSKFMTVSVPTDAKDKDGQAYTGNDAVKRYVQEKYLNDATKAIVFAATGKAGDLGTELNDGNDLSATRNEAHPTLNVKVTAKYGTPTDKAAKAGKYETQYSELAKQAEANTQTPQGLYTIAAEQDYGKDAKGKAVKYADIADLSAAPLSVKAELVQTNSQAKAYRLGETNEEVAIDLSKAVGDTINGTGTFQVSKPGAYGITVTTNKDAQDQTAKAQAEKDAKAAQPVIDAINALPKADDVNANNVSDVSKAAASAQAGYDQLTPDQKALVTNYATLGTVQAKVKSVNSSVAKAKGQTVKSLKVKAGKGKATVSWKAAKGYKYQVKYRQKNSSKTGDFKYKKTSKAKVTFKGLKKGKYYNFKVRAYKKVAGKTVYGKYTSIVTAKVK